LMHVISVTFPNELFYRNERQICIIHRHVTASKEQYIYIEYIEGIEQTASNVQKELPKARFAVVDSKIPFPSERCLTNALLAQSRNRKRGRLRVRSSLLTTRSFTVNVKHQLHCSKVGGTKRKYHAHGRPAKFRAASVRKFLRWSKVPTIDGIAFRHASGPPGYCAYWFVCYRRRDVQSTDFDFDSVDLENRPGAQQELAVTIDDKLVPRGCLALSDPGMEITRSASCHFGGLQR